jgi:hypothetical protein
MKTFLLAAVGSAITLASGSVPNLLAKLIVSAFILMGLLTTAAWWAPVGFEDESGLHLVYARRPMAVLYWPLSL